MFCPTKKAKGMNFCRRVNIGKQIEQIAKLFIIEFVPTTRHNEIDCFCYHKKECYYTTTVGANESRMKFSSVMPSAAQLVRSKCTVTFSMRKRQKIITNFAYILIKFAYNENRISKDAK